MLCLFLVCSLINFSYTLSCYTISQFNENIVDLHFKLSNYLTSRLRIEKICCKAFRVLIIIRLASNFRSHTSLKVLYYALDYPIPEYCNTIWDLHIVDDSLQLEWVQRRIFYFNEFILGITHSFVSL